MLLNDWFKFTLRSMTAYRMRSGLTVLGIAVGIAAVVLLTAIGEGIHRFVLAEFTQFGTHLLAINPGRVTTHGTPLGVLGSVRPLSIDDELALKHLPNVTATVAVMQGNAEIKHNEKRRRTTVFGVGPEMLSVFSITLRQGNFLPADDPHSPRTFAVLGAKVAAGLFGDESPLGALITVGEQRYRVIGVAATKGQIVGFDMDDTIFVPTQRALELFNREGVMEIDVLYREGSDVNEIVASVKRVLTTRHGEEDYTVTTQQQMLDVLGSILSILTMSVGALGGISLLVGAVGILTIMTIAVAERTGEIGLLRALGAQRWQISGLLLSEAAMLSGAGGVLGLLLGLGGALSLGWLFPALPVHAAPAYIVSAEILAIAVGLLAGVMPAYRAARMDPVEALRAE